MEVIKDIRALEALYGPANPTSVAKVMPEITPLYRAWIEAARFCILSTVGPEGTDATPRGDAGPVVRIVDPKTIWMPDWRGNNRLDALRNIVQDGRASLLFMVPGSSNVVRLNGGAMVTAAPEVTRSFVQNGRHPKSVILLHVEEAYFQCAKAILRSGLWTQDPDASVPSAGDFIREVDASFDGKSYDLGYETYAAERMW